ncbi:MAG: PIG-L family deacetylase [Ignavibacteriae bacterium]|nr:MAG: PIG-L family deacetylase [Ignavibacteriota bacterium]
MQPFLKTVSISLFILFTASGWSSAQLQPPLSPDIRCQQLLFGPTVLVITARPGDEDFEGLSRLRVSAGARVAILYVTNGESLPSEIKPWSPALLEARRKEEAVSAAHRFNGRAYFLNTPDIVIDTLARREEWNGDSIASKIASVVKLVKPHLVLFCEGRLLKSENVQNKIIEQAIVKAAHQCAAGKITGGPGSAPWQVQCIASTARRSSRSRTIELIRNDARSRNSKSLAEQARSSYSSLLLPERQNKDDGIGYRILEQHGGSSSNVIIDRIQFPSPRLRPVRDAVRSAAESLFNGRPGSGAKVSSALESISLCLKEGLNRYSELDQRALILWKGDLDYFQSKETEQYVDVSVSDSMVTERQIFFVSVKSNDPKFRSGINQILFHKTKNEDWVINESLEHLFDLNKDSVFTILSPEHLPFNTPAALYGLDRLTLDEPFRFSVIHQGKSQHESAIITKEVVLRYSPRYASVVQTPVVPIAPSSFVVVDSYNFTRDPAEGMLFVKDSICWSDTVHISLMQKDEGRRDTFNLHWVNGLPPGDYPVEIRGSNRSVGSFVGRTIPLPQKTAQRVILLSDRTESPLEDYARLAGLDIKILPWQEFFRDSLAMTDAVIVDRDTRIDFSAFERKIHSWLDGGGRLILLPQFSMTDRIHLFKTDISFRAVMPFSAYRLKGSKNYQDFVRKSDSEVRGVIDGAVPSLFHPLLTTKDDYLVLAQRQLGRGFIIISALDFDVWIGRLDPAGFELVTKILSQ